MLSRQQICSRARSAKLSCCLAAVEIRPKTQGLQLKQGSPQLVDAPQKDDVALFLHTSGTTSRPKVHVLKNRLTVHGDGLVCCAGSNEGCQRHYCSVKHSPTAQVGSGD